MSEALRVAAFYVVFHLAVLNALSMYSGAFAETWFLAPRSVITNKWHIRGVISLALGVLIIVFSAEYGLLNYGIFVGGALTVADPIFIYMALFLTGAERSNGIESPPRLDG